MKDKQDFSVMDIEGTMVNVSARMKALELLDNETEDYRRGFYDGYNLNQERVQAIDEIAMSLSFEG